MEVERIISKISEALDRADFTTIDKLLDKLLKTQQTYEAAEELARFIYSEYTTFRSGSLSVFLEKVIRKDAKLAQIHHPENPLFKLCVITGSKELFECYLEEAAEKTTHGKSPEEASEYYFELSIVARKMTDLFFEKFVQCIKGMDYNGAFSTLEENENVVLINREDYELLEDVTENFNKIVGRRDIISRLEKTSESFDEMDD
jgi:hypothetical protein